MSSGGRTVAHNRSVGGAPRSYHLLWLAVDVVYDEMPPEDDARETARQLGIHLIRETDHDHLQPLARG